MRRGYHNPAPYMRGERRLEAAPFPEWRPPVQEAPALELLPFRASAGLPVLHAFDREPSPLGIRVEALLDEEGADDADDGAADNDFNEDHNKRIDALSEPGALGALTSKTDSKTDKEEELAIVSGGASRFHARDWVVRQKAELKVLRERFAAWGGYEPGVWPAARLGRLAGTL
jgi:hypothetical protein